jgi:hypothetical protein
MHTKPETVVEQRERQIDEALKDTFPASDTPSYVGAGAKSNDRNKADQAVAQDERGQDQPADTKHSRGRTQK